MYIKNGKISDRQTFRLFVFDLLGIATLLLPPYLARLCGEDGIFAILAGVGLGFLYLFYLGWVMRNMGTDLSSYLRQNCGGFGRAFFLFGVLVHSTFSAGFCAYVFADLMQYSLIRETSFAVVLAVIVVVSAYAVSGGIESRARCYEVLFWFVLVPFAAMMLASVRNFEPMYVDSFLDTTPIQLVKGIYLVFLLLTPLFFSLFLIREKEKNYGVSMVKTVSISVLLSGGILLGSYVLLLGNFGEGALGNMRYPVVTLMSTIQFEGTFLKRMDALMLAVWFFTLYALLNLHLHYSVEMWKELTQKTKVWHLVLQAVLVFVIAWMMQNSYRWVELFFAYYSYLAAPLMVLVPGGLLLYKVQKS